MDHSLSQQVDVGLQSMVFAIAFGIGMIVIARRVKISAIATLLIAGILLGPEVLGLIQPRALGHGLRTIISIAVAIILFEGGLSLNIRGYQQASRVIKRLLSLGVIVTWLITSLAIKVLFHFPFLFSLLAGSLVIVTGPTVIQPLLRRVRANKNIHHILHWEGVLIDPIGVFIAIFCFELVFQPEASSALANFGLRFLTGAGIGTVVGLFVYLVIKKALISEEHSNILALAAAVFTFGVCDWILPESGLLGVVVAGFVLGIMKPEELEKIRKFKLDLTETLIGMLFILLAADLDLREFFHLGVRGVVLLFIVIMVVRPLAVFLSTRGSDLTLREKLFLSWIAPRGIVAASMATLFALRLSELNITESAFLETFTFSVIAVTVIVQGSIAKLVATMLKVRSPELTGWLIVGAHPLAEKFSAFIKESADAYVVIIDTNPKNVRELRFRGVNAIQANALDEDRLDDEDFVGIGNVLALTDNGQLNILICQQWTGMVGSKNCYRWGSKESEEVKRGKLPGTPVWQDLPKPSIVAGELSRGEAHTFIISASKITSDKVSLPLALYRNKKILLSPEHITAEYDEGMTFLLQRRLT